YRWLLPPLTHLFQQYLLQHEAIHLLFACSNTQWQSRPQKRFPADASVIMLKQSAYLLDPLSECCVSQHTFQVQTILYQQAMFLLNILLIHSSIISITLFSISFLIHPIHDDICLLLLCVRLMFLNNVFRRQVLHKNTRNQNLYPLDVKLLQLLRYLEMRLVLVEVLSHCKCYTENP